MTEDRIAEIAVAAAKKAAEQAATATTTDPYLIQVWPFDRAPEVLRAEFHPDDVDWLAVVPIKLAGTWIKWLECEHFGCSEIKEKPLPDGRFVYVGYHA